MNWGIGEDMVRVSMRGGVVGDEYIRCLESVKEDYYTTFFIDSIDGTRLVQQDTNNIYVSILCCYMNRKIAWKTG